VGGARGGVMEPKVRYTRSADGTRIAMWVLGSGRPPLVNPHSIWFTSMESFWHIPQEREGIERMAERRMLVRFDNRGHGLSQRDVSDFSLEARVNDLAAVVNHAGPPVDLLASGNAAPPGIAFAAAHPTEVRRLVLRSAVARLMARAQGLGLGPLDRVFSQMRRVDWETYVRTASAVTFGWNEVGLKVGEASLGSVAPELFVESLRAMREYDVTDLLSEIQCPTLVIHRKGDQIQPISVAQDLAAAIPNARLVVLDQERNLVFARESRVIIEEFLDEEEPLLKPARTEAGEFPPAPPSSSSPTSLTPPPSPNGSGTPPSARRPAISTPPFAQSSASTTGRRSKASFSATASSPSSPAPARLSRPLSPAAARATTLAFPFTSASTPATSSAKTTTSTAAR